MKTVKKLCLKKILIERLRSLLLLVFLSCLCCRIFVSVPVHYCCQVLAFLVPTQDCCWAHVPFFVPLPILFVDGTPVWHRLARLVLFETLTILLRNRSGARLSPDHYFSTRAGTLLCQSDTSLLGPGKTARAPCKIRLRAEGPLHEEAAGLSSLLKALHWSSDSCADGNGVNCSCQCNI